MQAVSEIVIDSIIETVYHDNLTRTNVARNPFHDAAIRAVNIFVSPLCCGMVTVVIFLGRLLGGQCSHTE